MVTHVDDDGFLYFEGIGGWDSQVLVGQRIRLLTRSGDVLGVIGKKPIHLMKGDDRDKVSKVEDLWIDVGAKDRDAATRSASGWATRASSTRACWSSGTDSSPAAPSTTASARTSSSRRSASSPRAGPPPWSPPWPPRRRRSASRRRRPHLRLRPPAADRSRGGRDLRVRRAGHREEGSGGPQAGERARHHPGLRDPHRARGPPRGDGRGGVHPLHAHRRARASPPPTPTPSTSPAPASPPP
jgi:hypothetical protein